ncbi:MAG: extracellular solute-binding protein [Lachnospiraceae bacterium]|nr:extracellular solute-binding protein [Lachnospiraceae bacterium]
MKKKMVALVIMATMVASAVLIGCNGASEDTGNDATTEAPADTADDGADDTAGDGEAINLTFWGLSEQADGKEEVIASFIEQHPNVTIEWSGHSNETLHQNLQISAVNDTLPSIWFMWGGALGGRYVQYGVSRDLTDFANANNWDNKFTPASLELATLHGELAGYPRVVNILAVYYNREIFADLSLDIPTDMGEFLNVVETIQAAGITPLNSASIPGWHIMRYWEQLLEHYAGAELHDQLQILEADWEGNEAVINSFATFQEYADAGFFPDGVLSMEAADLVMLLYPGEAAMQIEGPWFDNSILSDDQDLDRFGVFAFPNGGSNRLSAFGEMFMFNDNLSDAELEMAVAFLDYMFERAEDFPGLVGRPIPQIGKDYIPAELTNVPQIFEMGSANGVFTISDQALPPIVVDELFNLLDYLVLGTTTPEEAAASMQRAWERHLAED